MDPVGMGASPPLVCGDAKFCVPPPIGRGRAACQASAAPGSWPFRAASLAREQSGKSQRDTAFPAAVARYFWRRLLGLSGSVNSTRPCSMAGARYKARKLLRSDNPSFSCK